MKKLCLCVQSSVGADITSEEKDFGKIMIIVNSVNQASQIQSELTRFIQNHKKN